MSRTLTFWETFWFYTLLVAQAVLWTVSFVNISKAEYPLGGGQKVLFILVLVPAVILFFGSFLKIQITSNTQGQSAQPAPTQTAQTAQTSTPAGKPAV